MEENNPAQPESIEEIANQTEQPVSSQPPSGVLSKPIYRNKFFYLFALSFLLIAFLIGGFTLGKNQTNVLKVPPPDEPHYISPTPDPTVDWKTYEDEGGDYTIKIPPTWYWTHLPVMWLPNEDCAYLTIGKFDPLNNSAQITTCFFREDFSISKSNISNNINYEKTTINGHLAYKKKTAYDSMDADYLIVNDNGEYADFHLQSLQDMKLFEQIVSTIKFTNLKDLTANWNTYNSAVESSLSFKYPSSWTITKSSISPAPKGNSNVPEELESVKLVSKNGTQLFFGVGGNYIGGACGENSTYDIEYVAPLNKANGLYLVGVIQDSSDNYGIVSSKPKAGDRGKCNYNLIFYSKQDPKREITFSLFNKLNLDDSYEATQILESLKY